mgnify:CR=1 FL=1|tara:strand:- start:335 stop:550 length:216 start_codon:yes stop_codon:yes gene_type:complete
MNNALVNDAIDAVVTHCDFLKQIIENRNVNQLVFANQYASDSLLLITANKVVDGLREFATLISEAPHYESK